MNFRIVLLALALWAFPVTKGLEGATYSRLEASFNLGGLSADAVVLFDYAQTDVKVMIARPDGSSFEAPAFYDGGTTWRVRYAPTMTGTFSVGSITVNGAAASVSALTPSSWTVAGTPTNAGFIRIDPADARRFVTSDGRRFFPLGNNMAWSSPSANAVNIFPKMGAAHENWSRVWMTHFYEGSGLGLNLDWPKVNNAFGQLSLANARHWDAIVAAADQAGIHFQMALHHHGQYSSDVDSNWADNPYNTARGGFLTNATAFFTDATAKALTKRKLRYAITRWGYSPGIMAWELFNEVQFTDAARNGNWAAVAAWHDEMAAFLRAQDPYHHLITTSSDNFTQAHWNSMDYYQAHNYAADTINSSRNPPNPPVSAPVKPVFMGESTPHDSSSPARLWMHAPVWASLMAGDAGAACPWWWDTIDPENDYPLFKAAADFVAASALANRSGLVKSEPRVTGGGTGAALVFAPGGSWGNSTDDTFTVGSSAPTGIATAPSFLQGDYHRSMTPNGYTFLVNYAQAGTFAVQVKTIALSGAGLQIVSDGVIKTNVNFPKTAQDVSTNWTATIAIPAGAHTIKISNPGLDWIELGNITLSPYVGGLGAFALGNSSFNATWIWHRTNIFAVNATATTTGTIDVSGLSAGNYVGVWWDTFQGVALSNVTFTVTGPATAVTLGSPVFLRSMAFFASPEIRLSGARLTSGQIAFDWNAVAGASYLVQTKTNLSDAVWTPLNTVIAPGPTGLFTNDMASAGARFYRVKLGP